MNRFALAALAVFTVAITTQADARPRHYKATAAQPRAVIDVAAIPAYGPPGRATAPSYPSTDANGNISHYRGRTIWNKVSIPTPSGTWRVSRSCAQRLSAYWGLGSGLDSTSVWPHTFARAASPGHRVAVYTPGHVMGVVGGSEGAWRVVSFNGDGKHGNVEFTINSLRGYTLLDTTTRISFTGISAKRHRHIRVAHR